CRVRNHRETVDEIVVVAIGYGYPAKLTPGELVPPTFTVVVVGRPAAPPDRSEPLRARLAGQLSAFAKVQWVEDGGPSGWVTLADLLSAADGPAGVVDAGYVGHASPLADTLADSRLQSAQLHRDDTAVGVLRIGP